MYIRYNVRWAVRVPSTLVRTAPEPLFPCIVIMSCRARGHNGEPRGGKLAERDRDGDGRVGRRLAGAPPPAVDVLGKWGTVTGLGGLARPLGAHALPVEGRGPGTAAPGAGAGTTGPCARALVVPPAVAIGRVLAVGRCRLGVRWRLDRDWIGIG